MAKTWSEQIKRRDKDRKAAERNKARKARKARRENRKHMIEHPFSHAWEAITRGN